MKISDILLYSLANILFYSETWLSVAAANGNDDKVHTDASTLNLNKAAVYPLSCTNYKGMPLIKYELYDQKHSSQCNANPVGTYVTSLHRFMHSYWNYQALKLGEQFSLPSDAAYLSYCLGTKEYVNGKKLYAKIACAQKEKFASAKLRIYLYEDNLCTILFDDGQSIQKRISNGYQVNGNSYSTEVSFRPPFYSCESCYTDIADSFHKENWYDDDSMDAEKNNNNNNNVADDRYLVDDYVVKYAKHENRNLKTLTAEDGAIELFEKQFFEQRSLANDMEDWNLCKQLLLHGQWCDAKCQGTSFGSVSNWTASSVSVISTLAILMISVMVLIFSKRVVAYEMAESLQDPNVPKFRGFPPIYVAFSYVLIIVGILCLALLNMVHETILVASIVTVILFIYLMKLTLFDSARMAVVRKEKYMEAAKSHYQGPNLI